MMLNLYAKANNPRVEACGPQKPNSHIFYFEANNLYGRAIVRAFVAEQFFLMYSVALPWKTW